MRNFSSAVVGLCGGFILAGAAAAAYAQPTLYVGKSGTECQGKQGCTYGEVTVEFVDGTTGRRSEVLKYAPVTVDIDEIAVTPDGAKVYVTREAELITVDAVTGRVLGSIPLPSRPGEMAVSMDGLRLYVVARDAIFVIDARTDTLIGSVPVSRPWRLALSPDGSRLFVLRLRDTILDLGHVDVIDTALLQRTATIDVGHLPGGLAVSPDGSRLYVTNSAHTDDSVTVIDARVLTTIGTFPIAGHPDVIAVSLDGQQLFVGVWDAFTNVHSVSFVDTISMAVTATVPIVDPFGGFYGDVKDLALDGTGTRLFVRATNTIAVIDVPNPAVASWLWVGRLTAFAVAPKTVPRGVSRIVIDAPTPRASVGSRFEIVGWAGEDGATVLDGTGVSAVHVWARPATGGSDIFLGAAQYGLPRPDVAAAFGPSYQFSGFRLAAPGLSPGRYQLVISALSTRAQVFDRVTAIDVTVQPPLVRTTIDRPSAGARVRQPFDLSGWAVDIGAAAGSGVDAVHVWAYPETGAPVFVGAAAYGATRPDVASAFGARFEKSGFGIVVGGLQSGRYRLAVFARGTDTGTFAAAAVVSVDVAPPLRELVIDAPTPGSVAGVFDLYGWAVDERSDGGVAGIAAVHVWAIPVSGGPAVFLGAAQLGLDRPDVAASYGRPSAACGFWMTAVLRSGAYDLAVSALSTTSGTFDNVRTVRVIVP